MPKVPEMIAFTQRVFGWSDKDFGGASGLGRQGDQCLRGKVAHIWDVNRWKNDKEKPPKWRIPEIAKLYLAAINENMRCPDGFDYICDIGASYDDDREQRALSMLDQILVEVPAPPVAITAGLQIVIYIEPNRLPAKVKAQCFKDKAQQASTFIVVARTMRDAADEVWAHVFTQEPPVGFTIRES